ncbi:ferredoxin reductase-like protein [Pholiota conissans]|uniref:NADH-cytochrome b5 reductase n=1 Tax=Pholiota conissans TaxID=109636 RepID=A0A9P5Z2S2_9AGAR|nr:ferredoxin reductase-like protein [Pholiota conissans]
MPNEYQFVFLATFLSVFSALVLFSRFIDASLVAAGYDIRNLILIGLPKPTSTPHPPMSFQQLLDGFAATDFHAVDVPVIGTVDFVALTTSTTFIITSAIIVATAIWAKVFHTGRTKPLDPNAWKEFPLEQKIQVSPNTAIYRFKLPHIQDVLGLPVGQHISVTAEINGKDIVRSYTPISNDDDRGRFDLIIKTYEKGNISKHVSQLKIGDTIRIKGPKGNFLYTPNIVGHLSLIAGGTGIAPMIQVIRAALRNPFDRTTVTLIYANVNEEDILLKDDLEELQDVHEQKFKIIYVLNNPPPGWKGLAGFVTKEHIKEHLPNPATTDSKLLICGPPPMVSAMKKNLEELKYPVPNTISKLHDKVFVF